MRFLAFLNGATAVRGFVVTNLDCEVLAQAGATPDETWGSARVVGIAQDIAVAGALAGLGNFTGAALKAPKCSRLLAQSKEAFALIDLEPAYPTGELEDQLRTADWVSAAEPQESPAGEILAQEPDTVRPPPAPPRPRPAQKAPSSSTMSVATPLAVPPDAKVRVTLPAAPVVRAVPRPAESAAPVPRKPPPIALLARVGRPASAPTTTQQTTAAAGELASLVVPITLHTPASAQLPAPNAATAPASPLFTGSLRLFSLPDLLEFLRVGQRTGTLVCASVAGLGTIQLRRGRITAAATAGVPTVGDFLVQRQALTRVQLEDMQRLQAQSAIKTSLAGVLLAQRLVSRELLFEALMFQVVQVLRKLMSWDTGEFTFDPTSSSDVNVSDHEYELELDPQGVLLNIFKDMDDAQRT